MNNGIVSSSSYNSPFEGIYGLKSFQVDQIAPANPAFYINSPLHLQFANIENAFKVVMNVLSTDIPSATGRYQLVLPIAGTNLFVDWGDSTYSILPTANTGSSTRHNYGQPGRYIITIYGNITAFGSVSINAVLERVLSYGSASLIEASTRNTLPASNTASSRLIEAPPTISDKITSLFSVFNGCRFFNQNLSNWNTSNVTNLNNCFQNCSNLNQPFNSWNISKVTSIASAFSNCSALNQSFAGWDTSSVGSFGSVFAGCSSLNQDFSSWNFLKCTTLSNFMTGVTLNTSYYDALLILWDTYKTTWFNNGTNMSPNMGSSKYSAGAAATARANLVAKGWTITDGGQA